MGSKSEAQSRTYDNSTTIRNTRGLYRRFTHHIVEIAVVLLSSFCLPQTVLREVLTDKNEGKKKNNYTAASLKLATVVGGSVCELSLIHFLFMETLKWWQGQS